RVINGDIDIAIVISMCGHFLVTDAHRKREVSQLRGAKLPPPALVAEIIGMRPWVNGCRTIGFHGEHTTEDANTFPRSIPGVSTDRRHPAPLCHILYRCLVEGGFYFADDVA